MHERQVSNIWLLSALNPSKADSAFHPSKVKRFSPVYFTMSAIFRQDASSQESFLLCVNSVSMACVRCRLALADLAKMLLPPACPAFSPRGRQGGIFPQLCKECLLRCLKVEIACKYTGCPSAWGIIYVLRRVSASRWWRMSTVNWPFPTFASPGAFGTGESTQGKQLALEERLLCRVRQ